MASRRFFGYDPYDYYYTAHPSSYAYPYYHRQQQPAAARSAGGFFPAAEPVAVRPRPAASEVAMDPKPTRARTVSIPVRFVGSDPEPAPVTKKRAPSAEDAAVRVQAAARGFLARKAVRALRAVEREAEDVGEKVAREAEAMRADARARVAVGEALMRLLLRLDAVRGAREFRKRVAKRVLALQDTVDALEPRPESADAAGEPAASEAAADEVAVADLSDVAPQDAVDALEPRPEPADAAGELAPEAAAHEVEVADVSDIALPDAAEHGCETEPQAPAEAAADMDVDGVGAADEPCHGEDASDKTEQVAHGANHGEDTSGNAGTECEWEMVTEEPEPVLDAEPSADPPSQEPAGEVRKAVGAGGSSDGGVDSKKVMEMVAALCERSAQQCAVIGQLAERVDALERAVRRVEDAERRRRRAKKLRKEGKGSNHNKCYMD